MVWMVNWLAERVRRVNGLGKTIFLNHFPLEDGFYGGGQWGILSNANPNTSINCGSGATITDLPDAADFTAEAWFRCDSDTGFNQYIVKKGTGWFIRVSSSTSMRFAIYGDVCVLKDVTVSVCDGKWHHTALVWDWATKTLEAFVDGVSYGTESHAMTSYSSDAADDLFFCSFSSSSYILDGCIGYVRLSDTKRYTSDFIPSRTLPVADGNTVEQWPIDEGTGTTVAAVVTSPANDGTISNGTWEQQWNQVGSPVDAV
jgi:hypothetical protein